MLWVVSSRTVIDRLTGKNPWKWGDEEQTAFDQLKQQFSKHPILWQWDFAKKTQVLTDASGFACGAVLEQLDKSEGLWHLVAYCSEGMTETEHNYEIYN